MDLSKVEISEQVAAHVLYKYSHGYRGVHGGGFVDALLDVMGRADHENLMKLAQVFPGYARAVLLGSGLRGFDVLVGLAGPLAKVNTSNGEGVLETWIVEALSSSGDWVDQTSVEAYTFEEAVGLGLTVFRESGTVFYSVGAYSLGRVVD